MDLSANNLLEVIKQIVTETVNAGNPADYLYGEVMTVNPLSIKVDQKQILSEQFFVLTWAVKDHYIDMTVDHLTENAAGGSGHAAYASHNHPYVGRKTFLVHNDLSVGEHVVLGIVRGGQKLIVLDRVVTE